MALAERKEGMTTYHPSPTSSFGLPGAHLRPGSTPLGITTTERFHSPLNAANGGLNGERDQESLTISVVLPCRNEALNLPAVLSQLPTLVTEVIIVDGGSSDGTVNVAKEIVPDSVVVHQSGRGKGAALREGFLAARGDIIVMIDADGSMSPREINRMVAELMSGADVVKGSRNLPGGGSTDITRTRDIGNRGIVWAFNRMYAADLTDLCYGYIAFWRHHMDVLMPECKGFEVETLMNIRARLANLAVVESPSMEGRRIYGDSNLRPFSDGMRVSRVLLAEWWAARRRQPRSSQGARI